MGAGKDGKKETKEMAPRLRGTVILLGSVLMVALNLVLSARLHEHYRMLFPLAGFFAPVGVFLIIQGASTEDMRSGVVPRRSIQLMLASMLAGALLGLYANHVRFGHAL
jgi:drug/metabolite transporter (DMT)-like permease